MADTGKLPRELAIHQLIPYVSSERPLITLFMDLVAPAHGGPWPPVLLFHGLTQDLTSQRRRASCLASHGFCVLNMNLRGRGGTVGEPDANGWEIRDAMDALAAARRVYPQLCSAVEPPRAFGASGGGANVYALLGKCPDFLASAAVWCGVSDYAKWWEWNEKGNYRQKMRPWIGGTPKDNPEGYQSRSGVVVAPNRACPLRLVHGELDESVPVDQSREYVKADEARQAGVEAVDYQELKEIGHLIPEEPHLAEACEFLSKNGKAIYIPQRGRWVVAGYLKTNYFELRWDHVGLVGTLDVDLRRRRLYLECPSTTAAQLRLAGPVKEPELVFPVPKKCRILCVRQEAGWTVLDLQTHGRPLSLRWTV